ncbi:MAG: hypothetical protein IJC86_03425 [Clostridia bacterium]|nr:hypothetical protein [Clostridia bacterium]
MTNAADCNTSAANSENTCPQSVCIDALRVYDSCGDKDCLTDLRVFFTDQVQSIIDTAISVRIREADVISVLTDLEPVPFHKGFYSVDMTFFFDINLDVFTSPGSSPVQVDGLSIFNKKVILYGSEGSVKVFSSEYGLDEIDIQNNSTRNLPRASVQVAKPIALSAKLCEISAIVNPPCRIPDRICECFGGEFVTSATRNVFVTLGMFSIVQIERNVQMLVPSYDFCIPEKECTNSSDNPCEVFSRLDFPTNEFFPPNVGELSSDNGCSCGCCKQKPTCD